MPTQEHSPSKTPGEYVESGTRAVRPRDAATLIIVQQNRHEPQILMGKRAAEHKFMPNKFVFPGGRVDPIDSKIALPLDLKPDVLRALRKRTQARISTTRLRAIALAAIRETFEETGIVLGIKTQTPPKTRDSNWANYFAHDVLPPLPRLDFIARAITPTYRARRFDTRFFMSNADDIQNHPENMTHASGELINLHWLSLDDARKLDIPIITRQILDIVEARLNAPANTRHPIPFYQFRRGQSHIINL